jgi:N-acetylglucosamine-6-sulfatase
VVSFPNHVRRAGKAEALPDAVADLDSVSFGVFYKTLYSRDIVKECGKFEWIVLSRQKGSHQRGSRGGRLWHGRISPENVSSSQYAIRSETLYFDVSEIVLSLLAKLPSMPAHPSPRVVSHRHGVFLAGLTVIGVMLSVAQAESAAVAGQTVRPNVLFVLCDDIRWNAMSCAGHPTLKTPNIDRVAKEGVRFENMFCTTSLCSPSRASILTGLYAHGHGVRDNFSELHGGLTHWPKRLAEAGYETAYIGKWHMGENNDEPRPGFSFFATHKGQGKYFDTEWNINGAGSREVKGYYTTVVTDMALEWLRKDHAKKPWAMCIGHKAPHSFYTPEEKYAHVFDNVRVPYPETAFQLESKPGWIQERRSTWHGIYGPLFDWRKKFPDARPEAVKDFENMVHGYWGTILSVDDSMGRLFRYLEGSGELENTIVVFMGDNGLLEGEHGMVDKRTAHEASLRVPLLVRYPGLARGKVVSQQALTVDVAPSLLELCGAAPIENIHGKSWVPLVRGTDPSWRKSWFYEYNYEVQFPYTPNVRALRTDEWKYIHYPHGDGLPDRHLAELYNLKADPEERTNLIRKPEFAAKVAELKGELESSMKASGLTAAKDKMPLDQGVKSALPDAAIR